VISSRFTALPSFYTRSEAATNSEVLTTALLSDLLDGEYRHEQSSLVVFLRGVTDLLQPSRRQIGRTSPSQHLRAQERAR
jgi:hypothetical protein